MDEESIAYAQEGACEMLKVLAAHIPGDYTLNQIRVLQYINLCWRHRKIATSHAEICKELGLPSATVSRSIAKFVEHGIVQEQVDPADGRRRLVLGTGVIPGAPGEDLDRELHELNARLLREKPAR